MKILIICDSFFPTRNAPANRYLSLISYWSIDNQVTIITKNANKIDKNELSKFIKLDNFKLYSNKFFFKKQNIILKFLNLIIFFLYSLKLIFKIKLFKPDVVISSSPSLITLPIGHLFALLCKSKFIIEIRDIWSDSLKDLKIIKNQYFYKIIKKFESFFYNKASAIVCVSKNISDKINLDKIQLVHTNFASIDLIKKKYLYKNKIIRNNKSLNLLYVGTLGLSHEFQTIIDKICIEKKLSMTIVGEGLQKSNINSYIKSKNIGNIFIHDYTNSHSKLANYYFNSDFCLILLKNIEIFKSVIPSKLFELAFLEKIIIYFGPKNEASDLIKLYDIGFCAHNENDLFNILDNLEHFYIDDIKYKKNFEKFNRNFNTKLIALKYIDDIDKL
jgi:hypothetical protein